MDRWVSARRRVRGEPEVLREMLARRLPELLHEATGTDAARPDGDGSFTVRLISEAGHVPLQKRVRVRLEPVRTTGPWTRIGMQWFAEGGRPLFPLFQGAVELEALDSSWAELAVIGHYDPPMGPLGAFVDAIALRTSAQATVDWLATGLAGALAGALAGTEAVPPREPHRLIVRQVMALRPVELTEDDDLRTAARRLLTARVEGAVVRSARGDVVGVLSLKDLLDKVVPPRGGFGQPAKDRRRHHAAMTVGEACTRPALTTEADASLRDAAALMVDRQVGRLVVLDGAEVVGLVDRADAITSLIRSDEVLDRAVGDVLGDLDDGVAHRVEGGVVHLTGTVSQRSLHGNVQALVRDVDGVQRVDATGLRWEFDDVTPVLGV